MKIQNELHEWLEFINLYTSLVNIFKKNDVLTENLIKDTTVR